MKKKKYMLPHLDQGQRWSGETLIFMMPHSPRKDKPNMVEKLN
jgi:hypothetical protein